MNPYPISGNAPICHACGSDLASGMCLNCTRRVEVIEFIQSSCQVCSEIINTIGKEPLSYCDNCLFTAIERSQSRLGVRDAHYTT